MMATVKCPWLCFYYFNYYIYVQLSFSSLLCGDVEGRFEALFKKVEIIAKKSGQFDMLLCVGNFFGINNKELIPYKLGNKRGKI